MIQLLRNLHLLLVKVDRMPRGRFKVVVNRGMDMVRTLFQRTAPLEEALDAVSELLVGQTITRNTNEANPADAESTGPSRKMPGAVIRVYGWAIATRVGQQWLHASSEAARNLLVMYVWVALRREDLKQLWLFDGNYLGAVE